MLRTVLLTLAAANTLGGGAVAFLYQSLIVLLLGSLIPCLLHLVIEGEVPGDGNILGTSVHTVSAGGTGNGDCAADNVRYLPDNLLFLSILRLKVFHVAGIVLQLLHIAHAAEYHDDAV